MLNIIILVASFIVCLMVGILVVSCGLRDKKVLVYVLLTFWLLVLSVSNFLSLQVGNNQLLYVRGVMVSSSIVVYLGYILIQTLKKKKKDKPIYKDSLLYVTIFVIAIDCTDLLFSAVLPGTPPRPIVGYGLFIYFAHFIATLSMAIRRLLIDMKVARTKREKNQYSLLILGFVPTVVLVPITSFLLPRIGITETVAFTPFYAVWFALLVGYAIVKHGLFDVRRAVVRTVAYVLSVSVLSITYYCLVYVVSFTFFKDNFTSSSSVSFINIGLVLLLALLFQPIKHFFDQVTNSVFYKASYKTEDFFAQVNKILSNTNDLRSLLERVSNEIAQTLKSEQAFFFVNVDEEHYVTAGTDDYEKIPRYDIACLSKNLNDNNVIITSLLKEDDEIRKILLTYKIEIIMPLMYNREIFGYLFLGEHLTSGYASRDIEALRAISNSLVVGIRSALIVEEIKDLNASLQERIKDATEELRHKNNQLRQIDRIKDDFVSIASHQLRTPLTGIKGYISMILEGDVGKITSRQREFLNQAFVSSEQMVRLINDFLNLSRLQSGKFVVEKQQKDLSLIVQQEIETLITSSKSRGMKLVFKQNPEKFPLVWVDEDKIRQVVMNFTDNAVYYSADNSKIYLDLTLDGNDIVFTVKDSGIGVPKKDQSRLFTKFFRADNARRQRPDGTGVGLYLAKKVIIAHKGKLIFESKLGKGSTFGFRLPNMSDGTTVSDSDNLGDN